MTFFFCAGCVSPSLGSGHTPSKRSPLASYVTILRANFKFRSPRAYLLRMLTSARVSRAREVEVCFTRARSRVSLYPWG